MSVSSNSALPSKQLNNMQAKLIVFASGTKEGGGSGFENLVEATKRGVLDAEVVAVVSNHEHGGVRERADRLGIPFIFFTPDSDYQKIVADAGAEYIALSGWLKHVHRLDPARTINIHPALLSQFGGRFGGKGMYGTHLYEAVKEALDRGEITESGFTMHFVTEEHDRGPAFFEYRVPLERGMTVEEIAHRVHEAELLWQPKITNLVVRGEIHWDGSDPKTLVVPADFK
ncbi:MAG: hypothetical protein HYS26_04855 [Candidatus Kaiserbacteria bacterium]|nr:MAG: hypothetical protein HYS26_04855 [Candidatus Kaiserbacteria bacterium]